MPTLIPTSLMRYSFLLILGGRNNEISDDIMQNSLYFFNSIVLVYVWLCAYVHIPGVPSTSKLDFSKLALCYIIIGASYAVRRDYIHFCTEALIIINIILRCLAPNANFTLMCFQLNKMEKFCYPIPVPNLIIVWYLHLITMW